ncbi:MAG: InlB B-repeat-containing protein, partial [bacterium]
SGSGSVTLNPPGGVYNSGATVQLTATPAAGFQFSGWNGDLTGSTNPATLTMNANKNVTATFTAIGGSGQIVYQETKTGASSSSTTVTTATNLTAIGGDLYLAAIVSRSRKAVTGVSGMGLTWTLVKAQCSGRNLTGVEVWMARGTPNGNGTVTATFALAPSNAVIAVSRYSGVNAVNAIGNIISGNTLGLNGLCSGGTDNATYSFNFTTTANGAVIYGAAAIRSTTHTPGAGYTERVEIVQGSSSPATVAVQEKSMTTAGTVPLNGTFGNNNDWAVVGIELKP